MIVCKQPDGKYLVMNGGNVVAGPFDTNSEAWRALDRLSGQSVSKAEDTSEWVWNKMAGGEA
ncbi:hypothetical protein KUG47_13055 [Falsochrobactrum sp. TDYN1]|uniref:Uncharacterized protein n=1 Tax=Falsochrobactrum tianjinense TaxID=2706015 RepID=A0A949PP68_9HYPH|nr:hypothetical protein [Falsochrobactrum sp. TDYN1]MBV2144423.1 hypothetical protein [Falsochrobactrum sp. TDYN1]